MAHILSMTVVDRIIGSAPFVCEGDFMDGIRRAAALGYTGVELHATDPCSLDGEAIGKALNETGLALCALGTGRAYVNEHLSISDPDDTVRAAAVARLKDFINVASSLHSMVIIGCMRGNVNSADEIPAALERLGESMLTLDAYALDKDVTIVFEPINRYENNFLCNVGEICDFIHRYDLKATRVLLDTFHMNIEEADPEQTIRDHCADIAYVHIADSNRLYPGGGHTNFPHLLQVLEECGYRGAYSAECLPLPTKEEAQVRWLDYMKKQMASVE